MIVADNGSNWFISGAQDTNDTDLNQLKVVPGNVRGREHGRGAPQVGGAAAPVQSAGALLHPPGPDPVGPGQESAWGYPRPPRPSRCRAPHGGARWRDDRGHDGYCARDQPPAQLLLPTRRRRVRRAGGECGRFILRVEGPPTTSPCSPATGTRSARRRTPPRAPRLRHRPRRVHASRMDACYVDDELVVPQPGGFYGGWITARVVGPFKGGPGSRGW